MPQTRPFSWWVGVALDHFWLRVQGLVVFLRRPDAETPGAFLGRAIRRAGTAPRHLISDQEAMFTSNRFRGWCRRRGIHLRCGAVGKHGSIAAIERFFRTKKHECIRLILGSLRSGRARAEIGLYVGWDNSHRARAPLAGQRALRGAASAS